jgi:D-lactate dehydrogenase
MKLAVFEIEEWERKSFDALQDNNEVVFVQEPLTEELASEYSDAEAVSTFIYSDLGGSVLKKFPRLRLIATRSSGFDHIDLDHCQSKQITVCNVPSYGDNTVAEHVFGLLLTISHQLHEALDRTRRGDFSMEGLQGFDLRGKTLGVIGTGQIGRCVIEIANGFRMQVLAFDVQPDEAAADRLGFKYVGMEELLANSDVVTLHVPANEKTRHLLSTKQFGQMKKGAVLINTARGPLVDVRALLRALADGQIAAAGLDVLPEEPTIREEAELLRSYFKKEHKLESLLADHILLRLRNVYITPHSAFNTREAVQRILDTTVANIRSFAEEKPENVVPTIHGGKDQS